MRFRSRNDGPVISDSVVFYSENLGPDFNSSNPLGTQVIETRGAIPRVYPASEEMEDISSEGSGHDHPCYHRKVSAEVVPVPVKRGPVVLMKFNSGTSSMNVRKWMEIHGCHVQSTAATPVALPAGIVERVEISRVLNEHLSRCAVPLSESLSFGNFLLELKEIKQMARSLKQQVDKTALSPTFGAPEASLGWEFGVKPLISDLKAIGTAMKKLQKELAWLRKNAGKPVRIVTQRNVDIDEISDTSIQQTGSTYNTWGLYFMRHKNPGTCLVKCVSWVTYPKSVIDSSMFSVLAGLKAFGLTNPAKVIWNATRLSFVADWVINVNQLMDQLDLLPMVLQPVVDRETLHITVEKSTTIHVYANSGAYGGYKPLYTGETCFKWSERVYKRSVGIPFGGISFETPSLREQWLSTALLMAGINRYLDSIHRNWFKEQNEAIRKTNRERARERARLMRKSRKRA